jgi:hypothetical protein
VLLALVGEGFERGVAWRVLTIRMPGTSRDAERRGDPAVQASIIVLVVLLALVVFGFIGFVLYLPVAQMRAKIQHRTEVQKALIAKFATPQELEEFLNSEAGRVLLQGAKDDPAVAPIAPPVRPYKEQIGITIAWGVLGLCVGGAILLVHGPMLVGAVLGALGVAFVINALLRVLLSKTWGA